MSAQALLALVLPLALSLSAASCAPPRITLVVEGDPGDGAALTVSVYAPTTPVACDALVFDRAQKDALAPARLFEGPLDKLGDSTVPIGTAVLVVVEATRPGEARPRAAGCAALSAEQDTAAVTVSLETVARAATAEPVALLVQHDDDNAQVLALSERTGAAVPLLVTLQNADGQPVTARLRIEVQGDRGVVATTTTGAVAGLGELPLLRGVTERGPLSVVLRGAWSDAPLVLGALAIRRFDVAVPGGGEELRQLVLWGEEQGAPGSLAVVSLSQARDRVTLWAAQTATGALSLDEGPSVTGALTERWAVVGATRAPSGAARAVLGRKDNLSPTVDYLLVDDTLTTRDSATGDVPITAQAAVAVPGCAETRGRLLVGHRGDGDASNTLLTLDDDGLSATPIRADGPAAALGVLCFAGACLTDVDSGDPVVLGACQLFALSIPLDAFHFATSATTPSFSVTGASRYDIPGQLQTDGLALEPAAGGPGARVLVAAARNSGVELNAYAVDDGAVVYQSTEALLPERPAVLRASATLFGPGAPGVVVGSVVGDTAMVRVVGPPRGCDPTSGTCAPRATALVAVPCQGCAASPVDRATCALSREANAASLLEASCPPALLVETADVDGDGAAEVLVVGRDNGARTFTVLDLTP